MKLDETGAALAGDMGVLVSKMKDSIKAHIQASLKWPRTQMEDRSQRIQAANLGTKFLARGACTRYMLCGRFDPAAGSVNVASRWRTLS